MIALVLATVAVAPPSEPGIGTRITTELGVSKYNASYEAVRGDDALKTGVDGLGVRLRSTLGFPAIAGFVLGPSIGVEYAFVKTSGGGALKNATGARAGIEASYYPDPRIGFRINGGFGVIAASLNGGERLLAPASGIGSYFTLGLARDWSIGGRARIGGIIRVEADAVRGIDDDRRFHFRAITPSLSLVLVTGV